MPENQNNTPCSKLTKRNPDSELNSDTTPASDGQIQRPEMADNGREIGKLVGPWHRGFPFSRE